MGILAPICYASDGSKIFGSGYATPYSTTTTGIRIAPWMTWASLRSWVDTLWPTVQTPQQLKPVASSGCSTVPRPSGSVGGGSWNKIEVYHTQVTNGMKLSSVRSRTSRTQALTVDNQAISLTYAGGRIYGLTGPMYGKYLKPFNNLIAIPISSPSLSEPSEGLTTISLDILAVHCSGDKYMNMQILAMGSKVILICAENVRNSSMSSMSSNITMIDPTTTGIATFTTFNSIAADFTYSNAVPVLNGLSPFLFLGNSSGKVCSVPLNGPNAGVFFAHNPVVQVSDAFGIDHAHPNGSSSSQAGMIAGIVAAVFVVWMLIGFVVVRRRKQKTQEITAVQEQGKPNAETQGEKLSNDQKIVSNDQGSTVIDAKQNNSNNTAFADRPTFSQPQPKQQRESCYYQQQPHATASASSQPGAGSPLVVPTTPSLQQ
ncbi:hypothetical protein BGZ83_002905 [Gryganskiella cystojenkinii]|nr:hypothetical protein BGZ83_002905 [Gryganskiella cystojenkinii]